MNGTTWTLLGLPPDQPFLRKWNPPRGVSVAHVPLIMASSYPPIPYPSSSHPTAPPMMRLLVPMPIPRTPGAPYFDERGVGSFLNLILQHGSNAGINDADQLVSFIVRYSSDRVREII
ncbi:hypothetical protein B0H19DRAFT_1156414 [Mycena capillaripes]|nr:hypothetical protein B0H19DRAFT_1156414 [Mycena capillaripes]